MTQGKWPHELLTMLQYAADHYAFVELHIFPQEHTNPLQPFFLKHTCGGPSVLSSGVQRSFHRHAGVHGQLSAD
jgi:hypothetical protein